MDELETNRREFEAITGNMKEALIIIDHETHILSCNNSAHKLFGSSEADIGKSVFTLNRNEHFMQCVESALRGENCENTWRWATGVSDHRKPRDGRTGNDGRHALLFDVTEQQSRDQLRREFTANVSHELKTPLTSISGFAEIISKGYVKPEDVPRFARQHL